jgi:hypothetical protein
VARYAIYVCGGDFRERPEPNNTCPNRAEHTYGPAGYADWFEWASRLGAKRHVQSKCPDCGRFLIWTPRPVAVIVGDPTEGKAQP